MKLAEKLLQVAKSVYPKDVILGYDILSGFIILIWPPQYLQ